VRTRSIVVLLTSIAVTGAAAAVVAVRAADHPDSRTQSVADGCNRTQLGLLGEAAATMEAGPHPTPFASWVYVDGDNSPRTLEGQVLGTHTAGTDLFGVHDTYDLNIDVQPDPGYDQLLSSRNAAESPGQIHTEWESGNAPLFAWPSVGDHVRETGSEIWDCGHWQEGDRKVPGGDFAPGDPLGTAGAEPIGGEEIEIHPISELATWRVNGDFVPGGQRRPVHASRLDVAISNQGGKAKAVEECALLAPGHPANVAGRLVSGLDCSQLQDVTGRDYTYVLTPPGPRPSPRSQLRVQQDVRYIDHGPPPSSVRIDAVGDEAVITVPFSDIARSTGRQGFGATWHAWWSDDRTPSHRFRVTLERLVIRNNLDVDSGDTNGNPTITPEGEWNMFVEAGRQWTNLHDPRPGHVDYVPELGAVPSAEAAPQALPIDRVPSTDVSLPDGAALHLFSDARECDQPGYVDCPTRNELAATGRSAGRSEISLPVAQLAGHSTTVTVHPPVCAAGADCPEDRNPPSLCPQGCYELTFRIDDVTIGRPVPAPAIVGDGTPAGTSVGGRRASSFAWWIAPPTTYGPDQGEENITVARVIDMLRADR